MEKPLKRGETRETVALTGMEAGWYWYVMCGCMALGGFTADGSVPSSGGGDMADRDDLLLLLLLAPGRDGQSGVNGITRLEKIAFLVDREVDLTFLDGERFKFEPLHFGPFSRDIYNSLDLLVSCGLVDASDVQFAGQVETYEEGRLVEPDEDQPVVERRFRLTERGTRIAELLVQQIPPDAWKAIREIKERSSSIPLPQLIRSVYRKYPKFAEKSVLDHLKE
jgi:hypothetical protein